MNLEHLIRDAPPQWSRTDVSGTLVSIDTKHQTRYCDLQNPSSAKIKFITSQNPFNITTDNVQKIPRSQIETDDPSQLQMPQLGQLQLQQSLR